jgi:hypothetical protein
MNLLTLRIPVVAAALALLTVTGCGSQGPPGMVDGIPQASPGD